MLLLLSILNGGLAEEVGFEPTDRINSSIAVRARPCRAQKAH
jgi:hypothetical protein